MESFLSINIIWWQWVIVAIIFLVIEMFTITMNALAVAIAALSVGVLIYFKELAFNYQLAIFFIIFIIALTLKALLPKSIKEIKEPSVEAGLIGVASKDIKPLLVGKVELKAPVNGIKTWNAVSSFDIKKGKKVRVIKIKGELLEVEPIL